jgi:hypothetical protein
MDVEHPITRVRVAAHARVDARVAVGDGAAVIVGDGEANAGVAVLEQVDARARVGEEEIFRPRFVITIDVGREAAVLGRDVHSDAIPLRAKIGRQPNERDRVRAGFGFGGVLDRAAVRDADGLAFRRRARDERDDQK